MAANVVLGNAIGRALRSCASSQEQSAGDERNFHRASD
jgi:hypothetical protein